MSCCRNHQNDSDQQDHIRPLDTIFGGPDTRPLVLIPSRSRGCSGFALFVPLANQPRFTKKRIARRLPRVSLRSQLYSSMSSSPPPWLIQAIRCGQGVSYRARVLQPELFPATSLAFLQPTYPPKQDGGL